METKELFKSNLFKIFLVTTAAAMIIKIFQGGYQFGQWLYAYIN